MANVRLRDIKNVNTSDLKKIIGRKTNLPTVVVDNLIDEFLNEISNQLELGYSVNLMGICTFYPSPRLIGDDEFYQCTIKSEISSVLKSRCKDTRIKWVNLKKAKIRYEKYMEKEEEGKDKLEELVEKAD